MSNLEDDGNSYDSDKAQGKRERSQEISKSGSMDQEAGDKNGMGLLASVFQAKEQKKILEEFLEGEEEELKKNIDFSENLIKDTKQVVEVLVDQSYDYHMLVEYINGVNELLSKEINNYQDNINTLSEAKRKIEDETKQQQKKNDRYSEYYLSKLDELKQKKEKKDLEITITENNYNEISGIIKKNFNKKDNCLKQLNAFYQQNQSLRAQVEKMQKTKEELVKNYNNLLSENLNFKAKNEQYEIKKIIDFLEEISAEDKIQGGKYQKQKIKDLESNYYEEVNKYNTLAEQIINIVRTLEGLNIDNPRLSKELEIINKELYPFEKRLNRSFTQMYENHEWDDVQPISSIAERNKRAKFKKYVKNNKGLRTYYIAPK